MGPAVSCVLEIGIIPLRLNNPTVGLMPTIPQKEDGAITDPSVSVPIATAQKLAATAAAEPELEPQGLRSNMHGFFVCPPLLLQPFVDRVDLKLAHSLRFVFPSNTAPLSLNCFMMKASLAALFPAISEAPAVVIILSPVLILSFIKTGMPCIGPRTLPAFLSPSITSAIANASGFNSIIVLIAGPFLSIASMRFKYNSVMALAEYSPLCIFCCN